jgi:hypothetical protein
MLRWLAIILIVVLVWRGLRAFAEALWKGPPPGLG